MQVKNSSQVTEVKQQKIDYTHKQTHHTFSFLIEWFSWFRLYDFSCGATLWLDKASLLNYTVSQAGFD